jgi:hypothetical protein
MIVEECFDNSALHQALKWHNEPSIWEVANNQLVISPETGTDFWQRTHYGFQADSGHFLFAEVSGDFVLESHITCEFKHQYDQAGLMVRVSNECWVKTSVEHEIGEPNKLGAVVTNHGFSDWSTQDVGDDFTSYRLRIARKGSDYMVAWYDDKHTSWIQMRMFHLFDQAKVQAGIYCCSPKEGGFAAHFDRLVIE